MRYNIFGNNLPGVTIQLDQGESIYTQSGGMTWMSDGFKMETNAKGGFGKSLGRMFTGDSFFMATYTAEKPNQEITIASTFPGSLLALDVGPKEYVCQKSSFLCATCDVHLSMAAQKAKAGFFSGEGFLLQKLSGNGTAFLELDGTVVEKELAAGERIKVDTGNVALFESTVTITAETVKGFANVLFGGEGLFLTVLEGPGRIWLQTMNMAEFAGKIAKYIPNRNT